MFEMRVRNQRTGRNTHTHTHRGDGDSSRKDPGTFLLWWDVANYCTTAGRIFSADVHSCFPGSNCPVGLVSSSAWLGVLTLAQIVYYFVLFSIIEHKFMWNPYIVNMHLRLCSCRLCFSSVVSLGFPRDGICHVYHPGRQIMLCNPLLFDWVLV